MLGGAGAGRERLRFLDCFGGGFFAAGVDLPFVVIRSPSQRDSPIRHGALRIELGGIAERARGFLVIECVHQREALVEIALRQGIGSGDGMMQLAKSNQKRRGVGILLRIVSVLSKRGTRE